MNYQRPLWKALKDKSRHQFIEYFHLRGTLGETAYEQWQDMFDVLRSGRELPWHAVISGTDNLLSAIMGGQAQSTEPRVPDIGVPEVVIRYRTGLVLASGLVVMVLVTWGVIREQIPDAVSIGTAERCTFAVSTASGQATGTLYSDGGGNANRARVDFYTTYEGATQGDHLLMYPGWLYAWADGGKAGITVELTANADPKKTV